ncbi:ABC transporter substrate-binding protein, partial [Pseudomonas sp. MWU13-2860]
MKKALAVMALGLMTASIGAWAKDWKEVRFGVDASYAPFESKASNGQLVGFDIDLGNEICKRLKAKCVWVENDFDGMIPALKAKKFDGVLSSMSVTEARMKEISFSAKLFNTPTRMVAKTGSGLMPTPAALKGKRVGVEQGSAQADYAIANWQPAGVQVVSYQNQDQVYADLVTGRLDAAFQASIAASDGFLKKPQGKDFMFAGAPIDDAKYFGQGDGLGLRK